MSPLRRRLLWTSALGVAASAVIVVLVAPLARTGPLTFQLAGRELSLLDPRGLYALALLPLLAWTPTWSLADLSWSRRVLSALVRILLVSALALALCRPAELAASTLTSTVFVLDVSSSIDDASLQALKKRVTDAYAARGQHHVELVTFARDARRVAPNTNLARHEQGLATDIEGALALAMGLFEPGRLRQVVLLSDGRETHGELARAAERLRARDVRLFVAMPEGILPPEVAIRELMLPDKPKVGEPFNVRVQLAATVPTRARVRLFQNDLLNGIDGVRDVQLEAGDTEISFRAIARVGGPMSYRFELEPQGPDRFSENNRFERSVVVQGAPRVLYVEGVREQAHAFSDMLRAAGFDVDVRAASGAPASPRELAGFDFYVLSNVPRDALAFQAQQAIEPFMQAGGAFMMAGGDASFGLGGYRGASLEELLPVRLDTERRRDEPSLALALVIDKSGSMSGDKMELAKEAARATAELLASEDYLGVIGFDAEPTRVVRLGSAGNRIAIERGIGRLTSGGGTSIFPALDAAYADLASVRARVKHVILLTDGQTSEAGLPLLVQNMQVDNITVSAIGLGDDVNRALLEELARLGNGRSYFTTEASHVPRLFVRETNAVARSSAVEDYVSAQVTAPADFLKSIPMATAPFLRGYVATRARPSPAQVVLASDLGEPLLARMRVGLGWSLAWTSDVTPRWSAEWFRWPSFSAFWAQLIREHMRKSESEQLTLAAHTEGDTLVAAVDAFDANERFVNGLSGELRVTHPSSGDEQSLPLSQVAPGRYEARTALGRYGSFILRTTLRSGERTVLTGSASFARPFPEELAPLPEARAEQLRASLETAARRTGGGRLGTNQALYAGQGRRLMVPQERWASFAWLALGLFVLDVAARRLPRRTV